MANERILLIEDDEDIQELVRYNLEKNGHKVACCSSGESGLKKAKSDHPILVILDLMLPGIDGLTVCRELKADAATRNIRVIMLTAKSEDADVVAGLEVGADDYVSKPFSPRILLARVRAILRRNMEEGKQGSTPGIMALGDIEIDPARYSVSVKGRPVELTHTEFNILKLLAARPGVVFSRYQIVDAVHGADYPVTDRSVDVQIAGLRKKLKTCGDSIETVRGAGYRLRDSRK